MNDKTTDIRWTRLSMFLLGQNYKNSQRE